MTQYAVIVYSVFYVEGFVKMNMDHLCQMQHQIQAFFWEQVQTPVLQSWQSVPICDTGFPNQDPRNEKSASGPACRQSWGRRGSPPWWRSPEGPRRQHWPQLGLDWGRRTLLWSPPRWSPANRSAWGHGQKWVCDTDRHSQQLFFLKNKQTKRTLLMMGNKLHTTSTWPTGRPISSSASLNAVCTSSLSLGSLFPPGKHTSPPLVLSYTHSHNRLKFSSIRTLISLLMLLAFGIFTSFERKVIKVYSSPFFTNKGTSTEALGSTDNLNLFPMS